MRLLLDTHAFLWFIEGNTQLSLRARRAIEEATNTRYLSVASAWEIAIKANLGKLNLSEPFPLFMRRLERNAIDPLGISLDHLSLVAALPQHHRDPFDRLLVAQAISEEMHIISADTRLDAYGVARLW